LRIISAFKSLLWQYAINVLTDKSCTYGKGDYLFNSAHNSSEKLIIGQKIMCCWRIHPDESMFHIWRVFQMATGTVRRNVGGMEILAMGISGP
jgi:hypothetical protein